MSKISVKSQTLSMPLEHFLKQRETKCKAENVSRKSVFATEKTTQCDGGYVSYSFISMILNY